MTSDPARDQAHNLAELRRSGMSDGAVAAALFDAGGTDA
jgi:hypothetical protein